jgi:hypothetical protein
MINQFQRNGTREGMPASNKRFGEMAGEVTVRNFLSPLTVSVSPNFGGCEPPLRQAAGPL